MAFHIIDLCIFRCLQIISFVPAGAEGIAARLFLFTILHTVFFLICLQLSFVVNDPDVQTVSLINERSRLLRDAINDITSQRSSTFLALIGILHIMRQK